VLKCAVLVKAAHWRRRIGRGSFKNSSDTEASRSRRGPSRRADAIAMRSRGWTPGSDPITDPTPHHPDAIDRLDALVPETVGACEERL